METEKELLLHPWVTTFGFLQTNQEVTAYMWRLKLFETLPSHMNQ